MSQLHAIFNRTRSYIDRFTEIIQPIIDAAQDEHTRLYYHHILEEEEQRLGRLQELIPYVGSLDGEKKAEQLSDRELSRLLSDINLERFGLHNFREHLELSLYEFQDDETRQLLSSMRETTQEDYLRVKEIMATLSERFSDVHRPDLTDHDEGHDIHQVDHLKASAAPAIGHTGKAAPAFTEKTGKKGLTVGSLKGM
ncbi:IMEF encapsulin system ferritin-like cargo protein [Brevibacillus borstelensis]|uniref:IMEF encapsulin system ferritin-like cargo protein n=1 Tax=Brevibacillus borstelensis TaxID=45462 RepID=UPI0030C1B2DF